MEKTFNITGMHCESCINKIKKVFEANDQILSAKVSLNPQKAILNFKTDISLEKLRSIISQAGEYDIKDEILEDQKSLNKTSERKNNNSLYPLFLIVAYLLIVVLICGINSSNFTILWFFRNFMGGFFIVFSFFKFLDLPGFVSAFQGYDPLSKKFKIYGWCYPFIELLLGLAYLSESFLTISNIITILVMSIGAVGVFKVLLNKSSIQCACLGAVLNLPMTKVTLIENLTMIIMATIMILI